jgi:xanthine permease XanP
VGLTINRRGASGTSLLDRDTTGDWMIKQQDHDARNELRPQEKKQAPARQIAESDSTGELVYGTDSRPPIAMLLIAGLQHVTLLVMSLISTVIILRLSGLDEVQMRSHLALILIGLAIVNVIVSVRIGPIGAGLLLPVGGSLAFLLPASFAVREGGLALVSGMTIFSGVLMACLAPFLPRLRPFFPTEIAGLVILIIGLDISLIGQTAIMDHSMIDPAFSVQAYVISFAIIAAMVFLSVWVGGAVTNYAVIIGILVGIGCLFLSEALGYAPVAYEVDAPILAVPYLSTLSFAFRFDLVLVYSITTLAVALLLIGNITNAQMISDPKWVRPNMRSIVGGTLGGGLGTGVPPSGGPV